MKEQEQKIKLICLIADVYTKVFSSGGIYEGYIYSHIEAKMWVVYNNLEGKYMFHRPLKNFMPLADWREKQINSILDDVSN